ncbi:MAG: HD domain-containing protein, partial [Deltaproteobacteria bacterium]|nr:HD domain-containing protein [Deltaproteobacteria bacterium]
AGSEHARHAARVCRLALLIGRGLMLTDGVLQDLGIAALVHDIGYSQPGGSFATHTSAGVRVLLRQRGFQHAKVRRLLAVLHHHRDWDAARPPSVLGRILRVAEDYDALTRKAGSALSPALALARMCADPGRLYDPLSRQALVNGLGRYPPGTWLQLADGRVACVRAPATGELDKPRCYCGQDMIDLAVEGDVARVLSGPPQDGGRAA